jgi:hypothetical protein
MIIHINLLLQDELITFYLDLVSSLNSVVYESADGCCRCCLFLFVSHGKGGSRIGCIDEWAVGNRHDLVRRSDRRAGRPS